jgi:hypothetical protein
MIVLKNSLVHAWPEFEQSSSHFFNNVSVLWESPNIQNWDIEFVYKKN